MARKEEILTLADQLVKSVGYEGFSYADLSEKLGITKASIHHHFPRKEDLGSALCEGYLEDFKRRFDAIEKGPGTAWQKLEAYFRDGAKLVEDQGKTCPVAALQAQVNVLPDAVKSRLMSLDQLELEFCARVLDEGRTAGQLAFKGESRHQAALMVSAYKGALAFARVHGCRFLKDTIAQMRLTVGA